MERKIGRFVYWTPRMLSIIFILFLAMSSLDVISHQGSLAWQEIVLWLPIYETPVIALAIALSIAWRNEIVGGGAFFIDGLLFIFLILADPFERYTLSWNVIFSGIAFFIGVLFIIGGLRKRRRERAKKRESKFMKVLNYALIAIFILLVGFTIFISVFSYARANYYAHYAMGAFDRECQVDSDCIIYTAHQCCDVSVCTNKDQLNESLQRYDKLFPPQDYNGLDCICLDHGVRGCQCQNNLCRDIAIYSPEQSSDCDYAANQTEKDFCLNILARSTKQKKSSSAS